MILRERLSPESRALLLALTPQGWGETAFALHIATGLRASGIGAKILGRRATEPLFSAGSVPYEIVAEGTMPFLPLIVDTLIQDFKPEALILCDIATTERAFRHAAADPKRVLQYDVPIIGVDTWDAAATGTPIDIFLNETMPVATWVDEVPYRLKPVPFLRPDTAGACRFLPNVARTPARVREHVRREVGLGSDARLVLFCTAGWQHHDYDSADGRRISASIPVLLAQYLESLGPKTHLVHIGPAEYDLERHLGPRYHWLPPQTPAILDFTLAAADLLLTLNPSAATVVRAMVSDVPVLLLENGCTAHSIEDVTSFLESPPTSRVCAWLESALPIYAFTLWPLGFHSYLSPLFRGNQYIESLARAEVLDEPAVLGTMNSLIFDAAAADAQRQRQRSYIDTVLMLPEPADLVHQFLAL